MKHYYYQMLEEAKQLYLQGNFIQALENFQSLALILEEERQVPKALKIEINTYINKIQNPGSLEQEEQVLEKSSEEKKVAATKKLINTMRNCVNACFEAKQFEEAVIESKKLIELLQAMPDVKPLENADAFWNLGAAYESLACSIKDNDPEKYQVYILEASYAVQTALETYPPQRKYDIEECKIALHRLTSAIMPPSEVPTSKPLANKESSFNKNITARADEELSLASKEIFAIRINNQKEDEQYPKAIAHLNIALKLLGTKSELSQDDKEIFGYCTRTKDGILANLAKFKQMEELNKGQEPQKKAQERFPSHYLPYKKRRLSKCGS